MCSQLDSGLHTIIPWLILSPINPLRMRFQDVKTPQSFSSGVLLANSDRVWVFFVIFLLLSLYIVIITLHFLYSVFTYTNQIIPFYSSLYCYFRCCRVKKPTTPYFSKLRDCLLSCVNKTKGQGYRQNRITESQFGLEGTLRGPVPHPHNQPTKCILVKHPEGKFEL